MESKLLDLIMDCKEYLDEEASNELVLYYRLNLESVFDYNFWGNYTEWRGEIYPDGGR